MLLLAFGDGLEHKMRERSFGIGKGLVIAWPSRTTVPFGGFGRGRALRFRDEDVLKLAGEIPELEAVSPEYSDAEQLRAGANVYRVGLSGVYPAFVEKSARDIAWSGRAGTVEIRVSGS